MDPACTTLCVENVDLECMSEQQLIELAEAYETRQEPLPVDLQTRLLEAGIDVSSLD